MCKPDTVLSDLLRAAVETGGWSAIADRLAPGAVLDTSSEDGRRRIDGPEAIAAHLSGPGPGATRDWETQEWATGVALSFEWDGPASRDRRRWYVRADSGTITEIWSVAARPSAAGAAPDIEPPAALLAQLRTTAVTPLSHGGNSGAALLRATRDDGTTFVLKRVVAGGDWLARVTDDQGRTAQLYEAGAFERMPDAIGHGIVAIERAGDAAWIAMRDVGDQLLDPAARLTREQSRRILAAAAQMHHAFRGQVPHGAATLARRLGMAAPAVADAERAHPDLLPKQFEQGWDAFAELVPADVANPVLDLVGRPGDLATALIAAHGAPTLIHGDLRGDNLGFAGDRLVLIDWDLAAAGTPTVEFAWYLAHSARRIDATHDELEADHRATQTDLAGDEVELGLVSGLVQYGWRTAHSVRVHPDPAENAWARRDLDWWVPRVRTALERVGDV